MLSLGSKQVRPILENTGPSNNEEKKLKALITQQGNIKCKRNGYRKQSPGLQKQPSHPLYKDIKNEYIHVCKLTNAYNSLVKPQDGKVWVLQLLYRPRWRAGVSVTVERWSKETAGGRAEETKTPFHHHYTQCHASIWRLMIHH